MFLSHQTGTAAGIFPPPEKISGMKELPLIACSLTADQVPERRRRWQALPLAGRVATPAGVRLTFRAEPGVEEELRSLAELERECCGFANFVVSRSAGQVVLDVTSSGDGVTAARELFGPRGVR